MHRKHTFGALQRVRVAVAEWLQPSRSFHRFSKDLLLVPQPATTAAEGTSAHKMDGWLPLLLLEVMWDDML